MRKLCTLGAALLAVSACSNDLVVPNQNSPDISRVLAKPSDLEALVGNLFQNEHYATIGQSTSIRPALLTMAFENSSSLANFGMGPRGAIPRIFVDNSRGNAYQTENSIQFTQGQRAARTAANALVRLNSPGYSLGSRAQDLRAQAFSYFVLGVANGDVALAYDSLSVVTNRDTLDAPPKPLASAAAAMTVALSQLDSAIAIATRANNDPNFTLPATWINGNGNVTAAYLIQLARSYKARFRAEVGRTPAERAKADWAQIIADAAAGIPSDLNITMDPNTNWTIGDGQHYTFDTWTQQSPMIIGMADSVRSNCSAANAGGGDCYDAWLATPLNSRYAFTIRTADQRFPSGDTRAAQQASSGAGNFPVPPRANLYFRNRRSTDPPTDPYNLSFYDYYRFQAWASNNRSGPYPVFTRAELDLLMAEGYIRAGDFANAMARINISRVAKGGLPPLAGITSATQPIAAGAAATSCVPRVPQPPTYTTAACGTIWEAMKWEKRMETAYINYGAWYFDSRGWGDLPEGTPLEYPVPFQELDVRAKPSYNLGGVGGKSAAAKGTYGY